MVIITDSKYQCTTFTIGKSRYTLQPAFRPLDFKHFAVDVEEHDPDSMLSLYRDALRKRAMLLTSLHDPADFAWLGEDDLPGAGDADHASLIAYQRTTSMRDDGRPVLLDCITNFGDTPARLPQGDVILVSQPLLHAQDINGDDTDGDADSRQNEDDALFLPPDASAWIAVSADKKAHGAFGADHATAVSAPATQHTTEQAER